MNIKKAAVIAVVIAAAAGAGYWYVSSKQTVTVAPAPAVVETVKAEYGDKIEQGVSGTSTLKALEDVEIKAKVTARITSVKVKRGSYVHAGAHVVELDSSEARAETESQKAQVSISQADSQQAQTQLQDAQREYERYGRLLKEGYATQQEYDSRGTTLGEAKAKARSAAASVKQAQAQLSAKTSGLAEYSLKAPISGLILEDYDIAPGTMVDTSSNILRIANIDKLRAVIAIPEKDSASIHKGMEAEVNCDGIPGVKFRGIVSVVNPYVDESTRTVTVDILVDNTDKRLKPGMFSTVKFVQKVEEHPLVIPSEAISGGSVKIVENKKLKTVKVTTGAESGGRTSIKSGLKAGDMVVLSGAANVKDGDEVQIQAESDTKTAN